MAKFRYKALNATGKMLDGTMDAASSAEVVRVLDEAGFTPVSAKPLGAGDGRSWSERLTPDPKPAEITAFTLDLAMLLKGGVSLDEALVILTQMETRRWLVKLVRSLHTELSGGRSFSSVLGSHPALFPPLYVKMVEVAEMSGRLEEALTSIAAERQRTEALSKRLMSAISYPAFLGVAAIGVLFFVLLYIIPQFEGAIQGFRDRIDGSALFVFELSEGLRAVSGYILPTLIALLAAFLLAKRLMSGRSLGLELLSRLPFTRRLVIYSLTLTFCRTLSILLANGVDISTSLRLIRGISRVPRSAEAIDAVLADVRQGTRLSQALARRPLLPAHVVQMLRVGEEAGNLSESAARVSVFYEAKLDAALARFTAILGPVLMMSVSLLIGWLIISIMTALMSINDLLI
ncbi:type II secretion system F family protein [Aureimonas sp. AU12]|uniref:type II secretion system F family protein n=1 Tax=Aureimonas sp. AU12 TaxID=1638161 RepID=UPI000784498C|nr:type II secretion system F family protein [Aureimonas sp. AU12]